MAESNRQRIGKALDLLKDGLYPFVEREMKAKYQDQWRNRAAESFKNREASDLNWQDAYTLLHIMWHNWNNVFSTTLGSFQRSLVAELRDVRNRWAHQESFSTDDADRALDSIHRLLQDVSAPQAQVVDEMKHELRRITYEERARRESHKLANSMLEGGAGGGFKPWRDVVTPHRDVASGKYQQAEFAADLWQVYMDQFSEKSSLNPEYANPREFFRRTFLTEGLRRLLVATLRRLDGSGGDPVIELQTNFGGGKTHSLLALFHLFSNDTPASDLAGVDQLVAEASCTPAANVKRVVLVGTKLQPSGIIKPDGMIINTLWGELAYQLGGMEAYNLIRDSDKNSTNPGASLIELLQRYRPCLILVDEWVAYARQLYNKYDLPSGSFDTQFTFAQTLTEAVKSVNGTMLVVSIPQSDNELGGEAGKIALDRLQNAMGRIEAPWRPATEKESFEIVRQRLFQPITEEQKFRQRDAVIKKFMEIYRTNQSEYPSEVNDPGYEVLMKLSYPVHPEVFKRLYMEWSSLDKFQRTRGVLRLMAAVISNLWENNDKNLLILPASIPVYAVLAEFRKYLDEPWSAVVEKDIDGPSSLPMEIDQKIQNLGRYSACRRVARTIFMGSAPVVAAAGRGLDISRIKLGCVQPGESSATFSDALRYLLDESTHLYSDHSRYWYSTQPTVNRLAMDRAKQCRQEDVFEEIKRRLKTERNKPGDFAGIHPCPNSSGDVTDEKETRLVILGPEYPHISGNDQISKAKQFAENILQKRGNAPRIYRNTLVFLAADYNKRLSELEQSVRNYLAWCSIKSEKEELNLDTRQINLTEKRVEEACDTVDERISETYTLLLAPEMKNHKDRDYSWKTIRCKGGDSITVRASKKLEQEGLLYTQMGGDVLRYWLDNIPLWRGDHVKVTELVEDFATYLYLPKIKDNSVILKAIKDGVNRPTWASKGFGYAELYSQETAEYKGIKVGEPITPRLDNNCVLIKPQVALKLINHQSNLSSMPGISTATTAKETEGTRQVPGAEETTTGVSVATPKKRRFHGSVVLDKLQLGRDASRINEEIIRHLSRYYDSKIEITLHINAEIPNGISEDDVRTITENCRTLRFKDFDFEHN